MDHGGSDDQFSCPIGVTVLIVDHGDSDDPQNISCCAVDSIQS